MTNYAAEYSRRRYEESKRELERILGEEREPGIIHERIHGGDMEMERDSVQPAARVMKKGITWKQMYASGINIKNISLGSEEYQAMSSAAFHGDSTAEHAMGLWYEEHNKPELAKKWYAKAAKNGSGNAMQELRQLNNASVINNEIAEDCLVCGKDVYAMSSIKSAHTSIVSSYELEKFWRTHVANNKSASVSYDEIAKIIKEYKYEIAARIPAPKITKNDVSSFTYAPDPAKCKFMRTKDQNFELNETTDYIRGKFIRRIGITWKFMIDAPSATYCVTREIKLKEIMSVLGSLLNEREDRGVDRFFRILDLIPTGDAPDWLSSNYRAHSCEKIQADIRPVYNRWVRQEKFFNTYKDKSVLYLEFADGTEKYYLEDYCGFDIFQKEREFKSYLIQKEEEIKKREASNNPGEKEVEYAIKWSMQAIESYIVSIKNDCESKYRYNCIVLHKPEIIDELQEYDHILVCSAGIVLIETKHWKERVIIRPDGKWVRSYENRPDEGIESPRFQMRRHEILMQKICPGVSVHSVLCFSHPSSVIDGRENFKDYPIIATDQLEETLSALCAEGDYSKEEIDKIADTINKHKVYKPKKND